MKALKIILAPVAAFFIWVAYGSLILEPRAEANSKEFCASVKVGDMADGLLERALAAGADSKFTKWRSLSDQYRTTDERELWAMFIGMPPFSRHTCHVKSTSRVLDVRYVYMN